MRGIGTEHDEQAVLEFLRRGSATRGHFYHLPYDPNQVVNQRPIHVSQLLCGWGLAVFLPFVNSIGIKTGQHSIHDQPNLEDVRRRPWPGGLIWIFPPVPLFWAHVKVWTYLLAFRRLDHAKAASVRKVSDAKVRYLQVSPIKQDVSWLQVTMNNIP